MWHIKINRSEIVKPENDQDYEAMANEYGTR